MDPSKVVQFNYVVTKLSTDFDKKFNNKGSLLFQKNWTTMNEIKNKKAKKIIPRKKMYIMYL